MDAVRFRLGSDPELFLRDRKSKNFKSAIPVIAEGKEAPRRLNKQGLNGVLHDNVLIEFNTDPAEEGAGFVKNLGDVLKQIDGIVAKNGVELHLQSYVEFPEEELQDPEARIFGCDPDYDAYTLMQNVVPEEASHLPFRSAGGHLHIGAHEADEKLSAVLMDVYGRLAVVKVLDLFVGLTSVFLDKDPTSPTRRSLYGRAGAHRPKEYGVEYRSCSPWWLASPDHASLVYKLTEHALSVVTDEKQFAALLEAIGGEECLVNIINESMADRAREVFETHLRPLLSEDTQKLLNKVDSEKVEFRTSWGL